MSIPSFHVIIVAAGTSSRMKTELPKQYSALGGQPILQYSVDLFEKIQECRSLTIAINKDHQNLFNQTIKAGDARIVHGGSSRQESVYNALKSLPCKDDDLVLIHDAARPLVNPTDIKTLCLTLKDEKAASLASPVRDTLRYADEDCYAADTVERNNLWAVETPQGFHYGVLRQAHEKFGSQKEYTDDTKLVSELGIPTKFVPSTSPNFKITWPDDFLLAETILLSRKG